MDYGDWTDTCTNGPDDVCESPSNDPIKSAADILRINAAKIPIWLRQGDNINKLFEAFPEDFKDHWAARDEAARVDYWRERIDSAVPLFRNGNGGLRVRYATRRNFAKFPIFSDEECIKFDHQKYTKTQRGAEIEIDTGFVVRLDQFDDLLVG